MTVKASEGAKVPSPGKVKASGDVSTTGAAQGGPIPDSGKVVKTADEREALKTAAEAGSDKPPVSEDKVAKGIEPAADPARRIDEMTNDEAKQYSRDFNGGAVHKGDESRPAGKSDVIASNTGRRSEETESKYREHYTRGWNDHAKGDNNIEDYRGGGGTPEEKSAYLAGWHGNEREDSIGHAGGDMKRGEFEKARVTGNTGL